MILIIEQHGKRQAGTLKGRVLIGRWSDNTVVIDDHGVSRIHAWIGLQDGRYYVADAGSRTGTFINGTKLRERHVLQDGDQIRIGPAILRYRTDPAPPAEATPIDLSPRPPSELSGKLGVFMDCVCGAPLWLPREFAGVGQCRYCGHTVTQGVVPGASPAPVPAAQPSSNKPAPATTSGAVAANQDNADFAAAVKQAFTKPAPGAPVKKSPPAPVRAPGGAKSAVPPTPKPATSPAPIPAQVHGKSRAKTGSAVPVIPPPAGGSAPPALQPPNLAAGAQSEDERVCGVCHAPITLFDDTIDCPDCGLGFHAECWEENRGCSAYGCAQVGALGEREA